MKKTIPTTATTTAEQEVRWAKHFDDVLKRQPETAEADMQVSDTGLDVDVAQPESEEIIAVIL